ncbi:tape measure protein, partial [Enterococcus faecium]
TAGAGKLTTENWNQLADAIPGASGLLQDAMLKNGAYTGNFRDAMAQGQITSDEFNQAIVQLGMNDGAVKAATSTDTLSGSWEQMKS